MKHIINIFVNDTDIYIYITIYTLYNICMYICTSIYIINVDVCTACTSHLLNTSDGFQCPLNFELTDLSPWPLVTSPWSPTSATPTTSRPDTTREPAKSDWTRCPSHWCLSSRSAWSHVQMAQMVLGPQSGTCHSDGKLVCCLTCLTLFNPFQCFGPPSRFAKVQGSYE